MGNPDARLRKFMETYKVDSDEIWEVRTGGAWAMKHSALERVAAEQKITFDIPHFAEKDGLQGVVALLVVAHMGERTEWSIGEAAPKNNKNSYPYAMAEKRAKDRCILKLLNAHGTVYSEEEADDFSQKRQNPHVTRPEDIGLAIEYDAQGNPVDNIPHGEADIARLPKSHAKPDFASAQFEMRQIKSVEALQKWGASNANRIATYPMDWQEMMRGLYAEHMNDLRASKQAAQ